MQVARRSLVPKRKRGNPALRRLSGQRGDNKLTATMMESNMTIDSTSSAQLNLPDSMADISDSLSSELTRILDCPYPASLNHLADLLSRASVLTIRKCIHKLPPCLVSRLATLVCEALPLWPYTLLVLSHLCHSPDFATKLLLQYPHFLDALLTKANSSEGDPDDYDTTCTLLLSRPLPHSIPLPASAQSFFFRIFDKAIRSPQVNTFQPVYYMLRGACRHLISVLPVEKQRDFDRELCQILSSSNGPKQDFTLLLWCFGIVLLTESSDETEVLRTSNRSRDTAGSIVESNRVWRTASGRMLFGSTSKTYKTINLTYLSVIWATKGDIGISNEEAIESIHIAIRILTSIDQKLLIEWPKSSTLAKNTFPKLLSKILCTTINSNVRFAGLTVYAMVAGDGNFSSEVVAQYEQCLIGAVALLDPSDLDTILTISLPLFAAQLTEPFILNVLSGILDACILPTMHHHLPNHMIMAEQVTGVLKHCSVFRDKLSALAISPASQTKIQKLLTVETKGNVPNGHTYAASLQQLLFSSTIALLLTLAVTVQATESALPSCFTLPLISKHRFLLHPEECSHPRVSAKPSVVSLFQEKATPYTAQHLQDWRNRLNSELESQNSHQKDLIIHSVAQICQDLETRCNTVEEPLDRERERSRDLQSRVRQLSEEVSSLQCQAADGRFQMDGLEEERSVLADEKDKVAAKLEDLQQKYRETTQNAERAIQTAQEQLNATEIKLRSVILTLEEDVRARTLEAEAGNCKVIQLQDQLVRLQRQLQELEEHHRDLQKRYETAEHTIQHERAAVDAQHKETARLSICVTSLEAELQTSKGELKVITGRLSSMQAAHEALSRTSEEAYEELKTKYARDMATTAADGESHRKELHTKLTESLRDSQRVKNAYDETREDLRLLQITCSEQKGELVELRTWRTNVLASMGIGSQPPLAIRTTSRSPEDAPESSITPAPREHRRRKSSLQVTNKHMKAPIGSHWIANTAIEEIANASFTSSTSHLSQYESIPKRLKSQPPFEMTSMDKPYTEKPPTTSRSSSWRTSPVGRTALKQLSPNGQQTKVDLKPSTFEATVFSQQPHSLSREKRSSQGSETSDSNMESFLTGTALTSGSFAAGTGRLFVEDDNTTTEL